MPGIGIRGAGSGLRDPEETLFLTGEQKIRRIFF